MEKTGRRVKRAALTVLFYALSLTLFFAMARISTFLGLEYSIRYEAHPLDLTLISKQADPIIWLAASGASIVCAFVLAAQSRGRERLISFLYFPIGLAQIALFLSGGVAAAYWVSFVFGLAFLISILIEPKLSGVQGHPEGDKVQFVEVDGAIMMIPVKSLTEMHGMFREHAKALIEGVRELGREHRKEARE